jgi:hypothetical protein
MVPVDVIDVLTTVELSVAPVSVPAAAVIVLVVPNVIPPPLIVVDGISAFTIDLNVGAAADPVVGPANTRFADWLANVPVKVPDVVTGDPDTVIIEGRERATEVTVPPVPVATRVPAEKFSPLPNVISWTLAVEPVGLPKSVTVEACCSFAYVTALALTMLVTTLEAPMVVVMLVEPDPDTSPDNVIV